MYIVDKAALADKHRNEKMEDIQFDLTSTDYLVFDRFADIVVLERYHADFRKEGQHSYGYKLQSGRMK
ncbi:MAG: hypothetical protein IJV36_01305 [Prevotella sp.]|nr:hypothetical protein [Prevotella sp.]